MWMDDQVNEYAASKGYASGTILWATDKPLDEDAFRSGRGPNSNAAVDFLRWEDIGLEDTKGFGRIPASDYESHFVRPRRGISLFIKKMLPEGMTFAGSSPEAKKSDLKKQFDPLKERNWWKIESNHPIPAGLQLVYDGVPPGHCTLTCTRDLSVKQFLDLVSQVKFTFAGTDYYGTKA